MENDHLIALIFHEWYNTSFYSFSSSVIENYSNKKVLEACSWDSVYKKVNIMSCYDKTKAWPSRWKCTFFITIKFEIKNMLKI